MLHLKSHFVLGLLMVRAELKLLEVCTMTVWTEGRGGYLQENERHVL